MTMLSVAKVRMVTVRQIQNMAMTILEIALEAVVPAVISDTKPQQ
jgi:hypothetical protein